MSETLKTSVIMKTKFPLVTKNDKKSKILMLKTYLIWKKSTDAVLFKDRSDNEHNNLIIA